MAGTFGDFWYISVEIEPMTNVAYSIFVDFISIRFDKTRTKSQW